MPTESEIVTMPPISSTDSHHSSRASFASCPPEEDRERQSSQNESRDSRHELEQPSAQDQLSETRSHSDTDMTHDEHTTSSATTPEPEMGSHDAKDRHMRREEGDHLNDEERKAWQKLEEDMRTNAIPSDTSSDSPSALYEYYPQDRYRDLSRANSSVLRPGSKFIGTQTSDRQTYQVQVEIKDVDLAESFLCGYLRIQGLTDDHPTLTTFFEGEIIGPKYLFRTSHASWGSSEKVDLTHWARFPAWKPLAKSAKSPNFTLKNFAQRDHLFMRWKEYFLVPDHKVKTITGASFEGFYYICFDQINGGITGIYFHAKSEKFQKLELRHVEDHGCLPAVEFR